MNYDGKTYRNLEGQVGYLTDVLKQLDDRITEVAANIPSKMIVEELPETGDPNITYYVGPKGTEPNLYYEVWVWVQEEEEGPFVWRELEDTDQVDLSGYLPKVTDATTYAQVYGKNLGGGQTMYNATPSQIANAIVMRSGSSQVYVPALPTEYDHATSKKYVDDNFVAKRTDVTSAPIVYAKAADGSVDSFGVSTLSTGYYLVQRKSNGEITVPDTPNDNSSAVNKSYVLNNYIIKDTTTSSYPKVYAKNTDGTQDRVTYSSSVVNAAIVQRNATGQINAPDQSLYEPTSDQYISRRYADSHYGSGVTRYAHHVVASILMTNGETYPIVVNYVDGSGSPSTAFGQWEKDLYSVAPYDMGENSDSTEFRFTVIPFITDNHPFQEKGEGFLIHKIGGTDVVIDGSDDANIDTVSSVDTVYQI